MQIKADKIDLGEKILLSPLLNESAKFRQFYEEERKKKISRIHWARVSEMPEGIVAYADIFECAICYEKASMTSEDAYTMAHEIMHLIRYQENDVLIISPTQNKYIHLSRCLGSMLEDPNVDSFLQKYYDFNLQIEYEIKINYGENHIRDESDDLSKFVIGFQLADYILCSDLIEDQDFKDKWSSHLENWCKIRYPYGYKIALDTANIARDKVLGTIKEREEIALAIIDKYNLYDKLLVW